MQSVREWLSDWVKRVLPNSQAVSFAILLIVGSVLVISLGQMLMPVFAAGVIISTGRHCRCRRAEEITPPGGRHHRLRAFPGLSAVFVRRAPAAPVSTTAQLIEQLPAWINRGQMLVMHCRAISELHYRRTDLRVDRLGTAGARLGQAMLTYSYASLVSMITVIVYLILVPLLVFSSSKTGQHPRVVQPACPRPL